MVFCTPVAIATGAASAGATALGLGLSKETVEVQKGVFLMQMRQAKRLFTAGWAEATYHHGEALTQGAQQHSEACAYSSTALCQSEKQQSQNHKLARDQDNRSYEMTFRADIRELLRDGLVNQFNRYNIILLTNSVCLTSIYILLGGSPLSDDASQFQTSAYLLTLGGAISLFFVSMWFALTVIRRLHEHTATTLERKLFSDDDELQQAWTEEIQNQTPSGPRILYLADSAYSRWLSIYITPMGNHCLNILVAGVISMFVCGGIYTHARYSAAHRKFFSKTGVWLFWATVIISIGVVLTSLLIEDRHEKRKQHVYDVSYMDTPTVQGPMAKVQHASEDLFTSTAVQLGSQERADHYGSLEQTLKPYRPDNRVLYDKAETLRKNEVLIRSQMRKAVLEALTTAAEELDALPEDLIERLNKVIHDVSEADEGTAKIVSMPSASSPSSTLSSIIAREQPINKYSHQDDSDDDQYTEKVLAECPVESDQEAPMPVLPIDAKRMSVLLPSLRTKLGEFSLTSTIRIRNLSNEPLRLKSGVQLNQGQYIKSLDVKVFNDRRSRLSMYSHTERGRSGPADVGRKVVYYLFPITEIPPRTEAVVVSRSNGTGLLRTSGIDGELLYVNKSGTTRFHIAFSNGLISGNSTCRTYTACDYTTERDDTRSVNNVNWQISHESIAAKNNSEVLVEIFTIPQRLVALSNRRRNRRRILHERNEIDNDRDVYGVIKSEKSSPSTVVDHGKPNEANTTIATIISSCHKNVGSSSEPPSPTPKSIFRIADSDGPAPNAMLSNEEDAFGANNHTVSWEIDSLDV